MSVPDHFDARLQAFEARLDVRVQAQEDRLVQFMAREFEAVRHDLGAVERQVGSLRELMAGLQTQVAALVKQNGTIESESSHLRGAQAGQQRAIDDPYRRVQRLEERNGPPQKP